MLIYSITRFVRLALLLAEFLGAVAWRHALDACRHVLAVISEDDRSARRCWEARLLRRLLERASGSAVKIGQLFSTRPDLVPWEYTEELESLLDNVPPFSAEEAREIIERELGQPVDRLFARFEPRPVASASFAQVHAAQLPDGSAVAVKVQRPDMYRCILVDVRIIHLLAWLVDALGVTRRLDARRIAREFEEWTIRELDYRIEGRYAERYRRNARTAAGEYFPRVYWELTGRRVLTLEFLDGVWLRPGLEKLALEGSLPRVDRRAIASRIFQSMLRQSFCDGFFHADPHAGNIVVLDESTIGYVDFGLSGEIGEDFRRRQLALMRSMVKGDSDVIVEALLGLADVPVGADAWRYRSAMLKRVSAWLNAAQQPNAPLRERSIGSLLTANLRVGLECGLSFNDSELLFYRAVVASEMVVMRLNPSIDLRAEMDDFLRDFVRTEVYRGPLDGSYTWYAAMQAVARLPELLDKLAAHARDRRGTGRRIDTARRNAATLLRLLCLPALAGAAWMGWSGLSPWEGVGAASSAVLLFMASNLLHKSSVVPD